MRPNVPGVSDNIRVRSIIGRFLEHTRVYHFYNNGHDEIYAGSADIMERNLFHRVETVFPVELDKLKNRIKSELDDYLADNCQAWELQSDGNYLRRQPQVDEQPTCVQLKLLERWSYSHGPTALSITSTNDGQG